MAKYTIIRADNHVYIDGVMKEINVSELNEEISVIQWDDTHSKGHIEYVNNGAPGSVYKQNLYFSDWTPYSKYIDQWIAIVPPAEAPLTLTEYASRVRYKKEVGGIVFHTVPLETDDRAKAMLIGARLAAQSNPQFVTPWVGTDNAIYDVDAPTIIAMSDAVLAHVANCFSVYADVVTKIANNTITTEADIDKAFA